MADLPLAAQIRAAIDNGQADTIDAELVLRSLAAAGFVIVPREPTEEMIAAGTVGWDALDGRSSVRPMFSPLKHWKAMIDEAAREMILRHG